MSKTFATFSNSKIEELALLLQVYQLPCYANNNFTTEQDINEDFEDALIDKALYEQLQDENEMIAFSLYQSDLLQKTYHNTLT